MRGISSLFNLLDESIRGIVRDELKPLVEAISGECKYNAWWARLYTPTMIQKIGVDYFIVDCWHHRILHSQELEKPISFWRTLTCDIRGGHTISGDGDIYICDDTDYNAIRVFKKHENEFYQTQILGQIGRRPHFSFYDANAKRFYVISSLDGDFWILVNDSGEAKIERRVIIKEVADAYVRSFNFIDGFLYLISGNGFVYKIALDGESYRVVESFPVPNEIRGMNFIMKIGCWFYISSYNDNNWQISPKFFRVKNLADLASPDLWQDLYELFDFKGTPYYITHFDGRYFITEIDQASGVKSFCEKDGDIYDIRTHFFFDGHTPESEARKKEKY